MKILGIETSCDDCSIAVVNDQFETDIIKSFSQIKAHEPFGGVVPEIASRNHLEQIGILIETISNGNLSAFMADIDAIAVTSRPGLLGSLLVGVTAAKTLAYLFKKDLYSIHHLHGHVASLLLDPNTFKNFSNLFPMTCLMVSGGHTQIYQLKKPEDMYSPSPLFDCLKGSSKDDAAGEAFDKTGKLMGLPYPAGQAIDELSKTGDSGRFQLPRALMKRNDPPYDFSFSGMKTATAQLLQSLKSEYGPISTWPDTPLFSDLCASIQEAILEPLAVKSLKLAKESGSKSIAIVGGVAANSRIRKWLESSAGDLRIISPPLAFCSDNGAMISAAGHLLYRGGESPLTFAQLLSLEANAVSKI